MKIWRPPKRKRVGTMRFKGILFILILLSVYTVAEDKIYILVDNHIGFEGKSSVLQIYDKWCRVIMDECDNSPLCEMKFSIFMLGEEGVVTSKTYSMPGKPSKVIDKRACTNPGNMTQYEYRYLKPLRDSVSVFIESVPRPPFVDVAKGVNRVARESFRNGDTRTIYVVSNYKSLPEKYEAIEVTEFEEDRVPVKLYFTNVEDDKTLLNSTFKWNKNPKEVFTALRCYNSGEFK